MIESFWLCVATVDDVMIGCGQGREALCRDTEIVLQQARTSVHNRRVPVYTIGFLKFYVAIENLLSQQRSFGLVSPQGLGRGRSRHVAIEHLGHAIECAAAHTMRPTASRAHATTHTVCIRQTRHSALCCTLLSYCS